MSHDAEKRAEEMIHKLRKLKGLSPMTPEEADTAYDAAPSIPISPDKIHSIIESVTSRASVPWEPVPDDSDSIVWTHPSVTLLARKSDPYRAMVARARA